MDRILLAHGSGGRLAQQLVEEVFIESLTNPLLASMEDSATVDFHGQLAFTTDSYVVTPLFFPGGNIGKLAVCGTVNDLAASGAKPLYLSLAMILEEGLELSVLKEVVDTIRLAAQEAGVSIVTGDTKVVERGACQGMFINTAGVGRVPEGIVSSASRARPGDRILLSGAIGEHGMAVLSKRQGLTFQTEIRSDCAPLGELVANLVSVCPGVRCLRDPTRGGVATVLNEIAQRSGVGVFLDEGHIPIPEAVAGACEIMGFDPLYVANEGKMIAVVPVEQADDALSAMRRSPYGEGAQDIGEVTEEMPGKVLLRTAFGSTRFLPTLDGELLPRIC